MIWLVLILTSMGKPLARRQLGSIQRREWKSHWAGSSAGLNSLVPLVWIWPPCPPGSSSCLSMLLLKYFSHGRYWGQAEFRLNHSIVADTQSGLCLCCVVINHASTHAHTHTDRGTVNYTVLIIHKYILWNCACSGPWCLLFYLDMTFKELRAATFYTHTHTHTGTRSGVQILLL